MKFRINLFLSQIFPNPFNPSTAIKFSIPSGLNADSFSDNQNVSLVVYDILGNEIKSL